MADSTGFLTASISEKIIGADGLDQAWKPS